MIYSFPYNKIIDCDHKLIIAKNNKKGDCLNLNLQLNGLFTNNLLACPRKKSNFQKILTVKFFSDILHKKCFEKVNSLIFDTYDSFRNPIDIYNLYDNYDKKVISEKIISFIKDQIKQKKKCRSYQ